MAVTVNVNLKATAGGTANALTADFTPNASLDDKRIVFVRAALANDSSTVTLDTDGSGAKNVTQLGGQSLLVGDIAGAGHELMFMYNLAGTRWELLNPANKTDRRGTTYYLHSGTAAFERWYTQTVFGITVSTAARARDVLVAHPFIVERKITIDRIGIEITAAGTAGSVVRLGIYNDDGNIYPGTPLINAGTIAGDSATVQSIVINQEMEAGLYWLIYWHNSVASITFRAFGAEAGMLGMPSTLGGVNPANLINLTATYSATLPNPFTAGGAFASQASPVIAVRLSA